MAQLKGKKDEITGNLDSKYWVQKSDPLMLMRSVPFSLGELKILDIYISRINAMDDTRRTVIFTKEEYEELMDITCANYRALQKHTKGLLGKVVGLEMPNKDYLQFVLFTKAYYHKDEYGKPVIEITCTEEAKALFFCINRYHYFKYALENVINLTRKASYLLYVYMVSNRFRGEWTIDLNELRDTVLDCKKNESYQVYKIFKRDVLDPAVKEVNEKTDCKFTYDVIKRCRKVAAIKFSYIGAAELREDDESIGQISLPDDPAGTAEVSDLLYQAVDYELDSETIRLLVEKIKNKGVPEKDIPANLRELWLILIAENKRKHAKGEKIHDKARYLIRMIDNWNPVKEEHHKRSYDIEEWYRQAESYDPSTIKF